MRGYLFASSLWVLQYDSPHFHKQGAGRRNEDSLDLRLCSGPIRLGRFFSLSHSQRFSLLGILRRNRLTMFMSRPFQPLPLLPRLPTASKSA
jgi:hypothetical protein